MSVGIEPEGATQTGRTPFLKIPLTIVVGVISRMRNIAPGNLFLGCPCSVINIFAAPLSGGGWQDVLAEPFVLSRNNQLIIIGFSKMR